jgi:ubiquinone/menaquinone biosynthesis C-methylase UbiE
MKQAALFHPRIFDEQQWAEGYYKRNAKNIQRVGKRFAGLLKKSEFKGRSVLDAGCGFAAVPIEIAREFPEVDITGIDLGEPLLDLGRSLVDKAGFSNRIELLKGDVQHIDFDTDSFDLVINTFLLHIVKKPLDMLNEIERVARPDGKIMITDLRRGWLAWLIPKFRTSLTAPEAMNILSQSEIRQGKLSNGPFWWDYMAGL